MPWNFYCPVAVLYYKVNNYAEVNRRRCGFSIQWIYELSIRKTGNIHRYISLKTYFGSRFGIACGKKEALPFPFLLGCHIISNL